MQKIIATLKELNLKTSDLPSTISGTIGALQTKINKYNTACDAYDKLEDDDAETEKQLDETFSNIESTELEIVEKIKEFHTKREEEAQAQQQQTSQQQATANTGDAAAQQQQQQAAPDDKKEEGGSSWGGVIIAVLALGLTFGAVNLFKKK